MSTTPLTVRAFLEALTWIDGTPLLSRVEPYRLRLLELALESLDPADATRLRYNLILLGRAKKNWKTADLTIAALFALLADSPGGNQCYLLANDKDQAGDDLDLLKKIVRANPILGEVLQVRADCIERRDGRGFIEVLAAQDVAGSHGKTYRFAGFDEIHGYKNWDLLEAMQLDPTRRDGQIWVTSYASLFHRPGVPLFDLCKAGRGGTDPRMLFSWYAADFTTDPDSAGLDPESRANPSRASWGDPLYLDQQRRRLPAHKYRRLHLNLPGLPEGSAFQAESVMEAFVRGVTTRAPEAGVRYRASVDMSGGSNDNAVLAIGHRDVDDRAVVDVIVDQGPPPPFDPTKAIETRFVPALRAYGCATVTGDAYAGETFRAAFERHGIAYTVATQPASKNYEDLEPLLNGHRVLLLDVPTLEQELLGLIWRGGKIDHPGGEHDDHAAAVAQLILDLIGTAAVPFAGYLDYLRQRADAAPTTAPVDPDVPAHVLCRRLGGFHADPTSGRLVCSRCHTDLGPHVP